MNLQLELQKGLILGSFRTVLGATTESENHFDFLRQAAVCESIDHGEIELIKVSGEDQIADILTKSVDQKKLERIIRAIYNVVFVIVP